MMKSKWKWSGLLLAVLVCSASAQLVVQEYDEVNDSAVVTTAPADQYWLLSGTVADLSGFDGSANPFGWTVWQGYESVTVTNSVCEAFMGTIDTYPSRLKTDTTAYSLDMDTYRYLEITFARGVSSGEGMIYFRKDGNSVVTSGQSALFALSSATDTNRTSIILDMSDFAVWTGGNLTGLALNLHDGAGSSRNDTTDLIYSVRLATSLTATNAVGVVPAEQLLIQEYNTTADEVVSSTAPVNDYWELTGTVQDLSSFSGTNNPYGWQFWMGYESVTVTDGVFAASMGNIETDAAAFRTDTLAYSYNMDEYRYLELTLSREASSGEGILYFRKDGNSLATSDQRGYFDIDESVGADTVTYLFDLKYIDSWTGGNLTGFGMNIHDGAASSRNNTTDYLYSVRLATDIKKNSDPEEAAEFVNVQPAAGAAVKLTLSVPGTPERYELQGRSNLVTGSWGEIAQSTNGLAPFVITNLSYSAEEGGNRVIYVDSSALKAFYRVLNQ